MEWYLLKSASCLIIFYVFYKVFLENESIHVFKRFYLLVALLLSFTIPLITFTTYVEATQVYTPVFLEGSPATHIESVSEKNYFPLFLWIVYGAGVIFFFLKFNRNLWQMLQKIVRNPKIREDK